MKEDRDIEKTETDDMEEFLSTAGKIALAGGALAALLLLGTKKGRTAIGGALAALGIKTIKDNWSDNPPKVPPIVP